MTNPSASNLPLSRGYRIPATLAAIALITGAFFLLESQEPGGNRKGPRVLVLHDQPITRSWLGDIYSLKLENLLGHFDARVTNKPVGDYESSDIDRHDATFYIGSEWREGPLPFLFQRELRLTKKPFVWVGLNLWQYGWDFERDMPCDAFVSNYGFRLASWSGENHPIVTYKNTELKKDPFDPGLTRVEIEDTNKVIIHATCRDLDGRNWPYVVQSGNFWFVADLPLISTTYENRSLAFVDLLHDMLGIPHEESHLAYFRIEDVSPVADVEILEGLGRSLEELDVPFAVALIPEYRDWSGVYNDGVPETVRVTKNSPVTAEVKRWTTFGGQILQHGTTHQIDGLLNPYSGVSGDDYEFYRVTADEFGFLSLVGPLPGNSIANAKKRVNREKKLLLNAGFTPVGWLTPHYLSTPEGYKAFASIYPFACDRSILFFKDSQGVTQASELNSPYIYRDTYGLKRIPETIGYIDPWGWYEIQPPSLPNDLLQRAKALKVVRDGWAGFYFHWYLDPQFLRETVEGLKALGYEFTPLNGTLN